MHSLARILAPLIVGAIILIAWEAVVRIDQIPPYILPGPILIAEMPWRDGPSLLGALLVTMRITLAALAAAVILVGAIAILFAQSRLLALRQCYRWTAIFVTHSFSNRCFSRTASARAARKRRGTPPCSQCWV